MNVDLYAIPGVPGQVDIATHDPQPLEDLLPRIEAEPPLAPQKGRGGTDLNPGRVIEAESALAPQKGRVGSDLIPGLGRVGMTTLP